MIGAEFSKQLRRWRSRILLLICMAIAILISVGIGATAKSTVQPLGGSGLAVLLNRSGLAVGIAALLFTSGLLIPIVFAVSLGEPLASEARWGSLRYLLVRPVSRAGSSSRRSSSASSSLSGRPSSSRSWPRSSGPAYFGWHPIATIGGSVSSSTFPLFQLKHLAASSVAWRLLLATLYVALGSGALVGIAVLVAVATGTCSPPWQPGSAPTSCRTSSTR